MGSIAVTAGVARPDRPSWRATIWGVFRGYLEALVVGFLLIALLGFLGVKLWPNPGVEPGPWVVDGPWSAAADLFLAALAILVTSLLVHDSVVAATQRPVSPLVVLAAVALTGYAPFLTVHAIEKSVVALLVAAALIRYAGFDRRHSLRLGRTGFRALACLFALGAAAAVSYGATHPLWADGQDEGEFYGKRYSIVELRNNGLSKLRVLSADEHVVAMPGYPSALKLRRPAGLVVEPRQELVIAVPRRLCGTRVTVHYEFVGRTFAQTFVPCP